MAELELELEEATEARKKVQEEMRTAFIRAAQGLRDPGNIFLNLLLRNFLREARRQPRRVQYLQHLHGRIRQG